MLTMITHDRLEHAVFFVFKDPSSSRYLISTLRILNYIQRLISSAYVITSQDIGKWAKWEDINVNCAIEANITTNSTQGLLFP